MDKGCLSGAAFTTPACASNDSYIYIRTPTTITATKQGLSWDMNFLRRIVVLEADLTVRGLELLGFFSDVIPYFHFFMWGNDADLVLRNSTVTSFCGGQSAVAMQAFLAADVVRPLSPDWVTIS